jgi:hypothetical protein
MKMMYKYNTNTNAKYKNKYKYNTNTKCMYNATKHPLTLHLLACLPHGHELGTSLLEVFPQRRHFHCSTCDPTIMKFAQAFSTNFQDFISM